jgi:hypothetical protein
VHVKSHWKRLSGFSLTPPVMPSNLVKVLEDATLVHFAFLTSMMHMAWMRIVGGRLESRYRYSIKLVYNNFPLPVGGDFTKLEPLATAILQARQNHRGETLERLYDPDLMPFRFEGCTF